MSITPTQPKIKLVCLVSLWMATKIVEYNGWDAKDISQLMPAEIKGKFEHLPKEIVSAENVILEKLKHCTMPCTVYSFVAYIFHRLTWVQTPGQREWMQTLARNMTPPLNRVMELIDYATLYPESMKFLPSVLATTAVYKYVLTEKNGLFHPGEIMNVIKNNHIDLSDCIGWFPMISANKGVSSSSLNVRDNGTLQKFDARWLVFYNKQRQNKRVKQ